VKASVVPSKDQEGDMAMPGSIGQLAQVLARGPAAQMFLDLAVLAHEGDLGAEEVAACR
jgi:hypothetical protein